MALGVHRAVSIDTHVHGGKEQGDRAMGTEKRKPPKVTFYPKTQPGKESGRVCPIQKASLVRMSGVGEEKAWPIHI